MGLDQTAFAVTPEVAPLCFITERHLTDIEMEKLEQGRVAIANWRKHADLNKWMEDLYVSKGGTEAFNCVSLPLLREDILSLQRHLKENGNAYAERGHGFFWGETRPEDIENDHYFIERALKLLDEGYEVIYSCWW